MRVAVLGRGEWLLSAAELLVEAGHIIAVVVTSKPRSGSTHGSSQYRDLAAAAHAPFIHSQELVSEEIGETLRHCRADVGVSMDWPNLVGARVCSAFAHGILNFHAGALPRYRGNAPIVWAMLQGERAVGFTVHLMVPHGYDAGPVVLQRMYPIGPATYVSEVLEAAGAAAPEMMLQAVNQIQLGTVQLRRQDQGSVTPLRCYPRSAADNEIYWKSTAEEVVRLVRAVAEPYSGAYTWSVGVRLTIWRARWERWREPSLAVPGQCLWRDSARGEVAVAASDAVVMLQEVQGEVGGRQPAADAIKNMRTRFGLGPA